MLQLFTKNKMMTKEDIQLKIMEEYDRVNKFNGTLNYYEKKKEHLPVPEIVWYWAKPDKDLADKTMELIATK